MKIYTKKGDEGLTQILGGKILKKSDIRIEAYGTIDELNACIGLIYSKNNDKSLCLELNKIQNTLFTIGSLLACDPSKKNIKIPKIKDQDVTFLETTIDNYENNLPKITKFIIPGGNENSSLCHIARCVCRRAERLCVKLGKAHQLKLIIQYLNRLSDCLFVFARHVNMINDGKEIYWEPEN